MAGVTLGFLKYVLGFDSLAFRKGISQADADLAKMQKSFAAKGKEIEHLGRSLSTFVTAPLAGLATVGVHLAQQQVNAMAQVQAALKSTGGIAGVTAGQLKKASESFEVHSLFESQDVLKDVSARLLAFGSVHGATFNRAQQDILDYAQRTGKDLGAATVLIGKSLENPAKAAGALFKAGVTLTDGQKALIKQFAETGNAAGAQNIILTALETKYRGAAQAAADVDPYHNAHVALKQLSETIGGALLPLIKPLAEDIAAIVRVFTSLPTPVQSTAIALLAVAAAAGPVLIGIGALIKLAAGVKTIVLFSQGLLGLAGAETAAATGATAAGIATRGLIGILGPIAIAVTGVYLAWQNWDKIKPIVQHMVEGVAQQLRGNFHQLMVATRNDIKTTGDFFHDLYNRVVGHSYIPDMVDEIGQHLARLDGLMVKPAQKATAATSAAFQKLKDAVAQLLDQLFPEEAEARQQAADFALLAKAYEAGAISADRFAAALARLHGQSGFTAADIGAQPVATGTDTIDLDALDKALPKFDAIVDKTQQWKDLLADVGQQLSGLIGDDLARIVEGTAKLKDLWKDLLAFAIRFLTSENGIGKFFGGARAAGGPVAAGVPYLVGERGPEIFMPSGGGRILSNRDSRAAAGGGWGGTNVAMTVYATDADSFRRSDRQVVRSLQRRLR
jgi:hypothetical protein